MIVGKATSIQIVRNRRLSRGIAEHVIALSIAAPITLADRFDDDIGTIATGLMLGSVAVGVSLVRRSFRHRPNRLLLLRPFSEAAVSDSLNKLTRRTLSFLGFVFTLQDRDLRAGPLDSLARQFANLGGPVWAWLGPIRFAASSRDELRELKASLSSQVRLPWMWLASWRRLFPVATTDSFWQDAVAVLLTAADVVIIDLSELGPGSLWEIQQIKRSELASRTLLVARQGHLANAHSVVDTMLPELKERLFGYRPNGTLVRPQQFFEALDCCLAHPR